MLYAGTPGRIFRDPHAVLAQPLLLPGLHGLTFLAYTAIAKAVGDDKLEILT